MAAMLFRTQSDVRPTPCPSSLQLEAYLLGLTDLGPHLGSCERCRARLEQMLEEGEYFLKVVYPATSRKVIDSVEEAAEPVGLAGSWVAQRKLGS